MWAAMTRSARSRAGCYDLDGDPVKNCSKTVTVNSVGYDLSRMNKSLQFSQLTPGFYEYRVTVRMADGTSNVLLRQKFAVRNAQKNLPNATFYFDNGKSIKYCVTAEDSKSGSVPVLSYNTERDTMKIRAQAVGVNGYYRLMVEESGLYLTVYKSSAASGTKVIQYPKADKAGQYWQILPSPKDGYYYLMPKCAPTCCLSVAKDAVETGGTLEIRTARASAAQSWLLRYTRPLISNVRNVTSGVQVTWDVPAYATGYQIYRAAGSSGHLEAGEAGDQRQDSVLGGHQGDQWRQVSLQGEGAVWQCGKSPDAGGASLSGGPSGQALREEHQGKKADSHLVGQHQGHRLPALLRRKQALYRQQDPDHQRCAQQDQDHQRPGTRKEILCEGTSLEEGRSEQLFLRVDGGEAGSCQVIGTEQTADKDKENGSQTGESFF